MLSVDCKEKAEMKSALLRCSRRCSDRAQVSRITLPSACVFRAWLRENRNG